VPPRKLEAARLFYHYLQKELLQNDIWLFQMLTARLVAALGIWLDPRIYEQLPIVVPYATTTASSRDCRGAFPSEQVRVSFTATAESDAVSSPLTCGGA
jgi:hypothetical protein